MFTIIFPLFYSIRLGLWSRAELHVEILALRHQLLVLQRSNGNRRPRLSLTDRLLWVWLSELWSGWRSALRIVKPETVIAWHRRGFRLYWSWKSGHHPPGRPSMSAEVIALIRKMSQANPRWGAPRIHGELLKLGFELSEATVAKYMVRHRKPPSQTWCTFLANHMKDMVSSDFFVVPTVFFRVLFVRSAAHPEIVLRLLREFSNSSLAQQRCTSRPSDRASGDWPGNRNSPSRRTAPSLHTENCLNGDDIRTYSRGNVTVAVCSFARKSSAGCLQ